MEPDVIEETVENQNINSMSRSRRSHRIEQKTKKDFILTIIGIFVVLFLLAKFGLPLLINATLFISGSKDTEETQIKQQAKFVAPPSLLSTFDATNSAQVTIRGEGSAQDTIELYVNDEKKDTTTVGSNKKFSFSGVKLSKGQNTIQAKAIDSKDPEAKSDFSNTLSITFKSGEITLTVDSPSDNQSYSRDNNKAEVKGKTDPGNKVYVNNFWAIVDDAGNFSYTLPLQNGENEITIVATDDASNKTEVKKKVSYSQ